MPLALAVIGCGAWAAFGVDRGGAAAATNATLALEQSAVTPSTDPVADLARAVALCDERSFGEAHALLERVLAREPLNLAARHRLGLVLMEQGELERAELALATAADGEPENAAFVFGLAQVVGMQAATTDNPLAQLSLGTRSKKLLDRAIELDPTLVDARLGRILFYLLAPAMLGGGIERARAEAAAIAEVDATAGLFAQGWLAEVDEDFPRAEELHRAAIARDATYTAARFRLGYLLLGQERFGEAREQFATCCELAPRDPRSHQGLARCQLGLGDAGAAIAGHQRALELEPDLAASVFGLAECYAAPGPAADPQRAREHFARYLELEDEGRAADEARAWLAEHPAR